MSGYITPEGEYIKTDKAQKLAEDVSSTYKSYRHDRQREAHRADIVQPYKNGKLNPEFEMLYPDQAKLHKGVQDGIN